MRDRYQQFVASTPGRFVTRRVGLPQPAPLRRYEPGQPLLDGPARAGGGPLRDLVARLAPGSPAPDDDTLAALIFDASPIRSTEELVQVYEFFHPVIRRLQPSGRVV